MEGLMLNVMTADEVEQVVKVTDSHPEETRRMKKWLDDKIAAGKRQPFSEIITLSPVLAQLLLDRNPINRPINKYGAMELREDIANGRFEFNGEPIIVSDTGKLNDGQHRCLMVVQTGIPITTAIVFGPKESTRYTVDTGRSKTVSNFLAMKGKTYTHVLGAAAGYYVTWKERGSISRAVMRPTKQQILAAVDELKGLEQSVELTAACMKTVRSHAVLAFCHFVFWKRAGRVESDNFILRVIDGDGLRKGNPIYYCRNRLFGMGRGNPAEDRAELLFKCWNASRRGEHIDHVKIGGMLPKVER
jgi:hypothetical protein